MCPSLLSPGGKGEGQMGIGNAAGAGFCTRLASDRWQVAMAKLSKKPSDRIPSVLVGVAGEYFVAAELSRRGYIASISLRNTRGIDILATNADSSRAITIQCKTNQQGKKAWVLNEKCEEFHSANHFYVFVVLGDPDQRPFYHIVPSEALARFIKRDHRQWIATPGRNGQPHVDNPVRRFIDPDDAYLERWDLLGL
jgi:hypothetical protein